MKLDTQVAQTVVDFNGLHDLRYAANKDQNDKETLKQVAAQFESLFVSMMLKSMRDAQLAEGLFDSDQSRMYQDMADQQLSMDMSQKGGLGLQNVILRQLTGEDFIDSPMSPKSNSYAIDTVPVNPVVRQKAEAEIKTAIDAVTEQVPTVKPAEVNSASKSYNFDSPEHFVNQLWSHAKRASEQLGVEPEVILAQAALETGWGKHIIKSNDGQSTHNLFNIKADKSWDGELAQIGTLEFRNGVVVKEPAKFRSYDSFQQSFDDYVSFLQNNPRYRDALQQTGDSEQFIEAIHKAGYATDPAYADKIKRILNGDTLAQFSQSNDYS